MDIMKVEKPVEWKHSKWAKNLLGFLITGDPNNQDFNWVREDAIKHNNKKPF